MIERREAIRVNTPGLSLRRKAGLLDVHVSGIYYKPSFQEDVDVLNELQDLYILYPFMGYRRLTVMLHQRGYMINHKRTLRLMRMSGLQAIYPKKNLSKKRHEEAVYPYLLTTHPPHFSNDAWQVDITYIRMATGFLYLTALIDVISRRIMGWHLSPFLETSSCLTALQKGFETGYVPFIINSDQGCQFTSKAWIDCLLLKGIIISMDGKGRCLDNIYIERFWRSLKYEEVYLKTYDSVGEARKAIDDYMLWYNYHRPHQSLDYKTPECVFKESLLKSEKSQTCMNEFLPQTFKPYLGQKVKKLG